MIITTSTPGCARVVLYDDKGKRIGFAKWCDTDRMKALVNVRTPAGIVRPEVIEVPVAYIVSPFRNWGTPPDGMKAEDVDPFHHATPADPNGHDWAQPPPEFSR